ncbi:hypothetical protein BURK1_03127 [Burkholderiales bacterium]|nr:hypothetical protein BURK1_03127 [Burkholderiales bacterium]
MTHRHVVLDVRGMQPPEPIERVLETIGDFHAGDTLKLVIDCEPKPLFRILQANDYSWRVEPGTESNYEITIWARE